MADLLEGQRKQKTTMAKDQAYKWAEKRIEEARRSGAGAISLSMKDMELNELPESIGLLTQLTTLNLSNWTFDKSKACQKGWNCMRIGSCDQPISAVPR
jgi:hypothetical protein